jgi:Tfp pilus assembly protein PilF
MGATAPSAMTVDPTLAKGQGPQPEGRATLPFRLTVLGPVTIRPADAGAVTTSLTQSRQLALLSYLVLARPRGLQPRDVLCELLWPGQPPQRARRGLRNALYGLRQALGPDALVSAGEELVGVSPSAIVCDALELERGMLPLAGTDTGTCTPLDGLRVADAPAFTQWVANERERLRALLSAPRAGGIVASAVASRAAAPHAADPEVHYLRGHYLFLRAAPGGSPQDLEQSRVQFEHALELDPHYALALAGLSNYYAVLARRGPWAAFHSTFGQALDYAHRASELDHRLAIPHVHFAVSAQYVEGDWERAGREFATAVAKEPDYAEGRRFYGVWLSQVGRHEASLAEMETAAMLEPDIPHVLSSLGAARMACGDHTGAERALRKALAVDARHQPARMRLVRLLEEGSRWHEAVEERTRTPALPSSAAFADVVDEPGGYARVLRQAREEEARQIEARLLERPEPSTSDLFAPPVVRLVELLTVLGETGRARSWQLQACAANPTMAHWFTGLARSVPQRGG